MDRPRRAGSRPAKVFLVVAVVCAAASGAFTLWDPLDLDERAHLRRASLEAARSVREDLAADMQLRLGRLARLASVIAAQEWQGVEIRDLASRLTVASEPGDLGFQWIDASLFETWRVCFNCKSELPVPPFAGDRALHASIEAAGRRHEPVVSPAITLSSSRRATRIVAPALKDGSAVGFLVATLDTDAVLRSMLANHHALGYVIAVTESGAEIFRTRPQETRPETAFAQDTALSVPGAMWQIRVWPTPQAIDDIRSSLPEMALALGALLGTLLLAALYFARLARVSSNELRLAHAALEQRVEERTGELQRTNIELQGEIGERARAEVALHRLSGRLLTLQDEERRRIARDLHDSTGGLITGLMLKLDLAQRLASSADNLSLSGVLSESTDLLGCIATEIRTLSYLLHPPVLDELGLESVLPWYVAGFGKRSAIAVTCTVQPNLCLPYDVALTIFRIVQEALTNVHRHSGSGSASITVGRDDRRVVVEVADRGHGIRRDAFDAANMVTTELGVGIAGMRERVRQFSGELEILPSQKGTTVRVAIPVAPVSSPAPRRREGSESPHVHRAELAVFLPLDPPAALSAHGTLSAGQPAA